MEWVRKLFKSRITGKKLVILDADIVELDRYKALFTEKGYDVTAILVTNRDLGEFSEQSHAEQGGINNATIDLLARAHAKDETIPEVGHADFWAKSAADIINCLQQIQPRPDLVLTDSLRQGEKSQSLIPIENLAQQIHYYMPISVVLHTAEIKRFNTARSLEDYFGAGSSTTVIKVSHDDNCMDELLQTLLRRRAQAPPSGPLIRPFKSAGDLTVDQLNTDTRIEPPRR